MGEIATAGVYEERLLTGYTGRVLLVLTAGTMFTLGGQLILAPLLPTITEDLSLSPTQAGIAMSVMWALSAAGQYPGGRFADVLSRKTVLVAGLGTLIAGFVVLAGASTYPLLVLGLALVGAGAGLYPPTAYVKLGDLFEERRGKAFAIPSAAQDLGGAMAPVLVTVVIATATWRLAFVPFVLVLAVAVALVHRWVREPYVLGRASLDVRDTAGRLWRRPRIRWLLLASSLFAMVWQGSVSFLPTLLQTDKGFGPSVANALFSSLFLVGMVARLSSGWLADRFGYESVATWTAIAGGGGLVVVVFAPSLPAVVVGTVVFGAGLAGFWPVIQAYFMGLFPEESTGGDFGAIRTTYVALGSLGPTFVGYAADRASYVVAFDGLIVVTAATVGIMVWLSRFSARPGTSS